MTACSPPVWTSCGAGGIILEHHTEGDPPTALPTSASGSWSTTGSPTPQRQPLHLQAAELLSQGEQPQEGGACRQIARHFQLAGSRLRALEYRIRACDLDSSRAFEPFSPGGDAPAPRSPEELEEQTQQFLRELSALRREGADPAVLGRLELATALIQGRIALFRGTAPGAATSWAPSAAAASIPDTGCSSGPATCWPPPPSTARPLNRWSATPPPACACWSAPGTRSSRPSSSGFGAACSVSRAPMTRAATICWRPWTLCGDSPAPPRSGSSWRPSTVTTAGSAVSGWSTPTPAPTISGPLPAGETCPGPAASGSMSITGGPLLPWRTIPGPVSCFSMGMTTRKFSGELWGRTAASAYTAYYQAMEGGLRAGGGQLGRCPVLPAAAEFPLWRGSSST